MRKKTKVLLLLATLAIAAAILKPPPQTKSPHAHHGTIIVVGVDGANYKILQPLIEAGKLPNIKKLLDKGAYGNLTSEDPKASPVIWTTIFTGKQPKKHGIIGWRETTQPDYRQVEALWTITSDQNLKTAVINVPGTYPPEKVNGVMISGFPLADINRGFQYGRIYKINPTKKNTIRLPYKADAILHLTPYDKNGDMISDEIRVHVAQDTQDPLAILSPGEWSQWIEFSKPSGGRGLHKIKFVNSTKNEIILYITPLFNLPEPTKYVYTHPPDFSNTLFEKIGVYIPESIGWHGRIFDENPDKLNILLENTLEISRYHKAATQYLLESQQWDIFITVFTVTDRIMHRYWKYMEPHKFNNVDDKLADEFGETINNSFIKVDTYIGEILKHANENTTIVLVSDHGFKPARQMGLGVHSTEGVIILYGPNIRGGVFYNASVVDVTPTILYAMGLPVGGDMDGRVILEAFESDYLITHPVGEIPSYDKEYLKECFMQISSQDGGDEIACTEKQFYAHMTSKSEVDEYCYTLINENSRIYIILAQASNLSRIDPDASDWNDPDLPVSCVGDAWGCLRIDWERIDELPYAIEFKSLPLREEDTADGYVSVIRDGKSFCLKANKLAERDEETPLGLTVEVFGFVSEIKSPETEYTSFDLKKRLESLGYLM